MERQELASGWSERNERRPVRAAAIAYLPDGSAVAVRLTNISYEGCQLETEGMLPIGTKLKLALPRLGEINSQVRWSLEGSAGIIFLLEESSAEDRRPPPGLSAPTCRPDRQAS